IAGMVANNGSFNCNAAKLLVTPSGWEGRQRFIDSIEKSLAKASPRKAYYPGADQRWSKFTEGRKGLRLIGKAKPGELPYALITDVDPTRAEDPVFHEEPWCAVLSETALRGADPVSFLESAVRFANENVWGTLCATIIVHPKSLKDPAVQRAVENAIDDLRYGTVALNTWAAAVFAFGTAPWGAYPGSSLQDIQSGRGWVHNSFMLEGIQKCVLRAPLKSFPISPWFPGHRTLLHVARRLVDFEVDPRSLKVAGIASAAVRGGSDGALALDGHQGATVCSQRPRRSGDRWYPWCQPEGPLPSSDRRIVVERDRPSCIGIFRRQRHLRTGVPRRRRNRRRSTRLVLRCVFLQRADDGYHRLRHDESQEFLRQPAGDPGGDDRSARACRGDGARLREVFQTQGAGDVQPLCDHRSAGRDAHADVPHGQRARQLHRRGAARSGAAAHRNNDRGRVSAQ